VKESLCKAFCADLDVVKVPVGLAVSHRSWEFGGDRICLYVVGPDQNGLWKIQDDGTTVPYVEATDADLGLPARRELFTNFLSESSAVYNEETGELSTLPLAEAAVPSAAIRFFSLLTRVQDLALLTRERVEQTWVQEVERDLKNALASRATISKNAALAPELSDYPADLIIAAADRAPVALYFGISDAKAYEALLLRTQAKYHFGLDSPVILVLEDDNGISRRQRLRADANLIVPRYRGAEHDTIGRIVEEATGRRPDTSVH
jgi:hypothetical protein